MAIESMRTGDASDGRGLAAARELRDGEVAFVGIGLPNLACNLARALQAPNLVLIYESGAVGAVPERLPVSIGDPRWSPTRSLVCLDGGVFQLLPPGRQDRSGLPAVARRSTARAISTPR